MKLGGTNRRRFILKDVYLLYINHDRDMFKFLFSYSMTGAWRWSGHPISWKQTLSLHLWVDINLISLYCICIVIFARLEKKSPEFPLERCSNSRQSAKPRLRTSSPVIRSIKTYHLLSSNHINISKQNICFHACLVNYFYILWFSGLSISLVLWIVRLSLHNNKDSFLSSPESFPPLQWFPS